jgi:hypothetical protein
VRCRRDRKDGSGGEVLGYRRDGRRDVLGVGKWSCLGKWLLWKGNGMDGGRVSLASVQKEQGSSSHDTVLGC